MSLFDQLARLEQATRNIELYEFPNAHMFTNAIVNHPSITSLLKDPSNDEKHLYKIIKSRIPGQVHDISKIERVDGRKRYIEHDYNEESFYDTSYESQEQNHEDPITRLPTLLPPSNSTQQVNLTSSLNNIDNPLQRIERLLSIMTKYPNLIVNYDEVNTKLHQYQQDYNMVINDIDEMENEIEECKNVLKNDYKVAVSPVKKSRETGLLKSEYNDSQDQLIDLDILIQKEEEEVRKLEQEMNNWHNN
ncbi:hypothetical protein KGF56_004048 [Candida oxycetoniae]|uniref:DASH complex subunit SPC34 n=1 Tax=Candida oxycetoniae TaxID=497107 RepID=A0AAI9WWW9_9ASCO|nr:uncharacterized protein KGF56_004048 [Candida oxycetoniae]KAI3403159.2 hypothetical protein KGF56_004048 [Candida oxycetoniae]